MNDTQTNEKPDRSELWEKPDRSELWAVLNDTCSIVSLYTNVMIRDTADFTYDDDPQGQWFTSRETFEDLQGVAEGLLLLKDHLDGILERA